VLRIGCGAGFAGERLPPSVDLVERGSIDFLVLECLAERTIALAQRSKLADPSAGYDSLLERRVRSLLGPLLANNVRLVSNFGAANPLGGGRRIIEIATELGIDVDVAVVVGDDVLDRIDRKAVAWEDGIPLEDHGELLSANAYLGSEALLAGLEYGARITVTGRVADPSLFVACAAHHYGWDLGDLDLIARATIFGHLLECGPQVSGGYFANPPWKEVADLAHVGYPIAEIESDGSAVITKCPDRGGRVDLATVTEQLLYEVFDPAAYVTPDVVADFSTVQLEEVGPDRVSVRGGGSHGQPEQFKVSVGYHAGYRCEAEISYAGHGSLARARLAGEIVRKHLAAHVPEMRVDVIGQDSLHGQALSAGFEPYECRLRVVGLDQSQEVALTIGEEVTALYTAGPAGGGGVRVHLEEVIGVLSSQIPRDEAKPEVVYLESPECK
jgi:hypothetical protein